jgi:hypothetical protein
MSVLEKLELFSKLNQGMSIGVVRHHYDVNILIIHFIKRNEDKGRASVKASTVSSVKVSCVRHPDPFFEKMEEVLCA